jgi:hypothetical protein
MEDVSTQIHILTKEREHMTLTEAEVTEQLRLGQLSSSFYFWKEGMAEWRRLGEFATAGSPVPAVAAPVATAITPAPAAANVVSLPVTTTAAAPEEGEPSNAEQRDWWLLFYRFAASGIDFLLFALPVGGLGVYLQYAPPEKGVAQPHFVLFMALGFYIIVLGINQIVLALSGRSIGKSLLGIHARSEVLLRHEFDPRSLLRWPTHGLCGTLPLTVCFIHFPQVLVAVAIYALIDGAFILHYEKCLHDYIAGTIVVWNRH